MRGWKHNKKKNRWERECRHCAGSGIEHLSSYPGGGHGCSCPHGDRFNEEIDHPANYRPTDGVGWYLERCNDCSRVWLVYYEASDDSWDIPGPELVCQGQIPDPDWIPPGKENHEHFALRKK